MNSQLDEVENLLFLAGAGTVEVLYVLNSMVNASLLGGNPNQYIPVLSSSVLSSYLALSLS